MAAQLYWHRHQAGYWSLKTETGDIWAVVRPQVCAHGKLSYRFDVFAPQMKPWWQSRPSVYAAKNAVMRVLNRNRERIGSYELARAA